MIALFSNNSEVALTPDGLRLLTQTPATRESEAAPQRFRVHQLSQRLGAEKVEEIVRRYEAGESSTSLAKAFEVAPSALIRLMREQNVVVRKPRVSPEQTALLAREYAAGATMAELEKKHGLSHGAVFRALHRSDLQMRAMAPRAKSV